MKKPIRILIVEDSAADADLAQHEIRKVRSNCEFKVVESRESFISALETFQPEVILSNYSLPRFNGMEALKLTLQYAPLTPLIIWAGSISEDVAVECMKAGAHNYILKDNLKRLGPAVVHALEEREQLIVRRQAEETLQHSEERFRALIENGLDDISLLSAEGKLLWESPSTVRNLGYDPGAMLGHNMFELIHPDDQGWTRDLYASLLQEPGARREAIFRLRHSDGTWRWIEAIVTNMLDEPSVCAIVVNYRDVTRRRLAEEALRESQIKYQNLVETSHELIWSIDAEGKFTFVNQAAREIYGYEPEELIGRPFFEILDPEYYQEKDFENFNKMTARTNELRDFETYVRHRDGRQIILSANSIVMYDEHDNIIGVMGSSYDITKRKQAEEKLRRSENQYRLATKATNDVIWEWNPKTDQLIWSENSQHVFGYSREEIGPNSKWWDDHIHPDERNRVLTTLNALLANDGSLWQEEYRFLLKDGSYAHISDRGYIERDEHGTALRMIGAMSDITSRKQAEIERQALLEIMQGLANTKDLQELLKLVHASIARVIYAENFYVVLYRQDSGLFEEIYSVDQYDPPAEPSSLEGSITSYVFRSGESLLLTQASFEELVSRDEVKLVGTDSASWLGVPLKTSGRTIGVMAIQDYESDNRYSDRDKVFLTSIAAQVALVIERKQAEERLRESEEQFSSAFESASIGMALVNLEGQWLRVNRALCGLLGYSEPELLKRTFQDITHPEDLEGDLNYLRRLLAGEINSYQMEKRYFHKTGYIVWVLLSVSLVRDNRGNPQHLISQTQDITERKRAENELHLEKERFEGIAATAPGIICSLRLRPDGSTSMPFASPMIQDVYGFSPQDVQDDATPLFAQIHPDDLPNVQAAIHDSVQAMQPWRSEFRFRHPVKGEVWIEGRAVPLRESDDSIIWHGFIYDITERKRAEAAEHEQRILAEALRDTAETLNSTLDYGVVLDHILSAVGQVVPHDAGSILLIEGETARVVRSHGYDKYSSDAEIMGIRLSVHETTNLSQMLTTRQPAVVYDTYSYPGWKRMPATDWLRSSVGAPISIQGEIIGFICLDSQQPEFFTPVHAKRLEAFANQAALAIHNARLLQQAQSEIAERKQAEAGLRASEERFRQLADNIEEVFWMTEVGTDKELYMSPAAESVWGHPVEYLMSEPNAFINSVLPEDQSSVLHTMERQRRGEKTELEYRIRRPDGAVRWVWDRAFPVFDDSGKVTRIAGISADITERRMAEQQLRKLSRAVEQTASTIIITDMVGNIEYVNPKFTEVTGFSSEEVIGQNPRILKSGLTSPQEYEQLWQTIASGREWHGELLNRKKNGELYWESVTISPIFDGHGKITHFVGVKEDITQRKQSELETRRHVAELEAVYENGLAVGRLLEPGEIGNRVIETFARYLPWHHVTIRLRKDQSDDLELVSFNLPNLKEEERANAQQHFVARINKVGQGLSGWVIQTGQPLRTGNVHAHPQYVGTHSGIQSGLYMPLKVAERVIGVISVESETPDAFTEQDERLLATLANQTAIAFENARLYEAMQKELAERKRAQDALHTSEAHYRALADSITDILFEMDQDLNYTHWNRASEALTGIPASEAIGKSMEEIFGATEEQVRIKEIYEEVLRSHQSKTFETTLALAGEIRSFEINAYPSMRGVSVVAKDVTDRKRTETVMQKRFELMEFSAKHSLNELMQRMVDEVSELTGSTIGFYHFVESDQITLVTQTCSTHAQQHFNVSADQGTHLPLDKAGVWAEAVRQRRPLIQNDYESLTEKKGLPEGHVPILREMVIPIIRSEQIVAVMGLGNKPQDYTVYDLDIATRIADYAWDITERKQMEIALEAERNQLAQRVEERTADLSRANSNLARALRVKDEFLANMSHELRTPLNAILGLSESLGEQIAGPLNEKQQKYISTISESGHHLLSLINDILDLAKIDAGQISLDINKVDIRSVCQASLRMIKQLAQKKHQEVSLDIDDSLGWMWADERRLKQMIVNLLGNAVKFTPEHGHLGVEVRGDQEANQISITVWDNGIGIDENDLARLFQPFVQLDSGLAREATGTGLGLALVAQMARLHGGSVNAASEAGQGSRFTIILPWEPVLMMDSASRMKITGKFRAVKIDETNQPAILLVEDTKEVVMMLKDYLELTGYKVFTAQDGVDALVQARHVKPDLILMDIQMPRMDGFETTRKLRSDPKFRYTPIIALTALAMPHDRERCLEAGMNEYISKPVNLKALMKIIQNCLFKEETRA